MTTIFNNLPALKGSEKQISWAKSIRSIAVDSLKRYAKPITPTLNEIQVEMVTATNAVIEEILSHDSASWWIDHQSDYYVAETLIEMIRARGLAPRAVAQFDAHMAAKKAKV